MDSTAELQESQSLRLAYDITITCTLVIIILGMGCGVTPDLIKIHLRRPTGVAIGLLSQIIILPFLSFALAHSLGFETIPAIGMLVMAVSPCGMMSSVFSYWVDGDVPLSFTISTLSTVLAFGTIPLNLLIYSGSWTDEDFVVPYRSILIVVGITITPLVLGVGIRWKFSRVASVVLKIGSIAGILLVALSLILLSVLYPFMYSASWKIYVAAVSYPYVSFMFGYVVSTLFRMENSQRRTVALETGMQNYALCFAILESSFSAEKFSVMSIFPLLYGVNVLIAGIVFVGFYKILKKYGPKPIKTYSPNEARLQREIKDSQVSEAFLEVRVTNAGGREERCDN